MSKWSLDGVWGKLDRADEHLQALKDEISASIQGQPGPFRGQIEAQGTEYVLRAHTGSLNLLRLGLIFGDAIQNLRASLDHLICQMVIASKGTVSKQQFPIFTFDSSGNRRASERWATMTENLDPVFLREVKRVQPYQIAQGADHPLAMLARFSNADKHRVVVPTILAISKEVIDALGLIPHDLQVIGEVEVTFEKPLNDGEPILRLPVRATGPDPHVEIQGYLPLDIAFGENLVSSSGIQGIREFTHEIIESFEALLGER